MLYQHGTLKYVTSIKCAFEKQPVFFLVFFYESLEKKISTTKYGHENVKMSGTVANNNGLQYGIKQ